MKIYFCDICNESIPLKDINSNRITIEDGKIFCPRCAPKKPRRPDRVPASLVTGMYLGFLVLIAGLTAAIWLGSATRDGIEDDMRGLRADVSLIGSDIAGLQTRLRDVDRGLKALEGEVEKQGGWQRDAVKELQARLGDLDARAAAAVEKEEAERMRTVSEGASAVTARLDPLTRQMQDLTVELRGLSVSQKALEDRFTLMKDLITSRAPATPVAAVAPDGVDAGTGMPAAAADGAQDKEIDGLIAQLGSKDPGIRFQSIVELGRYSGDKVVTALEGMLKDPEDYVRKVAVQGVRKQGRVSSVPRLIDALRDGDYFVRKAARDALRSQTNESFGFDPDGSASERESKVKLWESWWQGNKERLLAGS